jgi:hypothetical protein
MSFLPAFPIYQQVRVSGSFHFKAGVDGIEKCQTHKDIQQVSSGLENLVLDGGFMFKQKIDAALQVMILYVLGNIQVNLFGSPSFCHQLGRSCQRPVGKVTKRGSPTGVVIECLPRQDM